MLDLMRHLERLSSISVDDMRMIFAGQQLKEGNTLAECDVQKESTITMTRRLRGD